MYCKKLKFLSLCLSRDATRVSLPLSLPLSVSCPRFQSCDGQLRLFTIISFVHLSAVELKSPRCDCDVYLARVLLVSSPVIKVKDTHYGAGCWIERNRAAEDSDKLGVCCSLHRGSAQQHTGQHSRNAHANRHGRYFESSSKLSEGIGKT